MKNVLLAFACAFCLTLAFPNFNFPFLIWVALVPLFILLDGKKPLAALGWGWLTGFLFFLGTHYWLIHVTLPGMILVNIYLAFYFAIFAVGYAVFQKISGFHRLWVFPSLWVACEFMRDRFLSGFGWASLGHAQYLVLPLIQIADVTGVFGLSFVIVMVNILVKDLVDKKIQLIPVAITLLVLTLVAGYGFSRLKQCAVMGEGGLSILIIQPNIPQAEKWRGQSVNKIQAKLLNLTEQELKKESSSLVIWPETSFPGYLWESPERFEAIQAFVKQHRVPLLFGAVTRDDDRYYNSAMLLSAQGEVVSQYHKMHLVPFGEYLPFRRQLRFLEDVVPIGDFTAGQELTQFPIGPNLQFSVLICFEDTVASVVRSLTKQGADFLVNITNDGWFQESNAPVLHLQAAAFQAVANRRDMLRSANTGVSAHITRAGRIVSVVQNQSGKKVAIEGSISPWVHVSLGSKVKKTYTFYTLYGDVFAYLCVFASGLGLINRKYLL